LPEHSGSSALSFAKAYSFDAGRVEMTALMSKTPAQAYFCGDDVLSIGALSAQDAGLKVPEDIGLIGLNDMEMAGWQNIDLTTIRQPIAEIIVLLDRACGRHARGTDRYPETRLFPCRVIERGTLPAPVA
jgi:DNA-binding LacI/PurR family transcriptional regulator